MKVRDTLIHAGARNLREYGYLDASADNILTVPVFAAFFRSMLESNLGHGDEADRITRDLIDEIDAAHPGKAQ